MASATEICNLALSHLRVGKEISNIDTDRGEEAQVCRRFYETTRDLVLGDFEWPFATKIVDLALVEEDPNSEWAYSYRYPSDALKLRRLIGASRNESRQSRTAFRVAQDSSGKVIWTDQSNAELEYTVSVTDTSFFSADFVMALSFLLAAYIAPRITGGDPFKLGDKSFQLYGLHIANARANARNEEQPDEEVDSEFVRVRES